MANRINPFKRARVIKLGMALACGMMALNVAAPPAARAQSLTISPGSVGAIQYSVRDLGANSPTPLFSPFVVADPTSPDPTNPRTINFGQQLTSPGDNYPTLGPPTLNGIFTNFGSLFPGNLSSNAPSSDTFGNGRFGSGRTVVSARSQTPTAVTVKDTSGTFFSPARVVDTQVGTTASVSVTGSDTFLFNNGSTGANATIGNTLKVTGSVGTNSTDFVAAALTGSYTTYQLSNPALGDIPSNRIFGATVQLNGVVVEFSGPNGGRPNLVKIVGGNGSVISSRTINPTDPNSRTFTDGATAFLNVNNTRPGDPTSNPPLSITIGAKQGLELKGTLTLIADPGSIEVTDFGPSIDLPDIGNFTIQAVPEPASLVGYGMGMACMLGCWVRRRRVAGHARVPRDADTSRT